VKQKQRLILAMSAYAAIALVAWRALPEKFFVERVGYVRVSTPVILLMVLFAFKSFVHRHDGLHEAKVSDGVESEGRE